MAAHARRVGPAPGWSDIVALAQMVEELPASRRPKECMPELPPPPPGPVPMMARNNFKPTNPNDPKPECPFCKARGLTYQHHERVCFVNPESMHYKPHLAKRRLEAAKSTETANFAPLHNAKENLED